MKRKWHKPMFVLTALIIIPFCAAVADEYDIDWYTVDGGGEMRSTGGNFELSGTIGQPDAGLMAGEPYTLSGGFWAVPPCRCISDVNNDGLRNGQDIEDFIRCMLASGSNCACADIVTDGTLDLEDVAEFVGDLLAGGTCP